MYNHNKAQQSKNRVHIFLGYTVHPTLLPDVITYPCPNSSAALTNLSISLSKRHSMMQLTLTPFRSQVQAFFAFLTHIRLLFFTLFAPNIFHSAFLWKQNDKTDMI